MADALLDTTVFIDYYRRHPGAEAVLEAVMSGAITASYSPITVVELWRGQMYRHEEIVYEAALVLMEEAQLTASMAKRTGEWLRPLEDSPREETVRDALIAATASERGEPISTRNVRDSQRFYDNVQTY